MIGSGPGRLSCELRTRISATRMTPPTHGPLFMPIRKSTRSSPAAGPGRRPRAITTPVPDVVDSTTPRPAGFVPSANRRLPLAWTWISAPSYAFRSRT